MIFEATFRADPSANFEFTGVRITRKFKAFFSLIIIFQIHLRQKRRAENQRLLPNLYSDLVISKMSIRKFLDISNIIAFIFSGFQLR